MKTYSSKYFGILLLLLAQLMVGVCIVGSKALLADMSPIVILTVRFIIGALILLIFHLAFSAEKFHILKKLTRKDWFFIIAQALCAGALFNILLLTGLKYTSASVAGIITSVLPAVITLLSIIFLRERLTMVTFLCVVFSVLGLIIINVHSFQFRSANSILGDVIILIALLPEATYYILVKMHTNKLPVFLISSLMNAINIPLFLILMAFTHHAFPTDIFRLQPLLILLLVGIGSALFYVFWFLGSKHISGTTAGLTTAFMPIATLLIAYLGLNETISLLQLVGMLMVICSIFLNTRA